MKKPQIITPIPGAKPIEREIRIEWDGMGRPKLDHLTGPEAKTLASSLLIQVRDLNKQRETLSSLLVGFVHREAVRGLCDAHGAPMLPMRSTIPADSARVALERWRFSSAQQPDGAVAVEVVRDETPPQEAPRVIS